MPTTINTPRDSTLKTTEQTPRNIADVLADELSGIAQAIANGGSTDYDNLTHRPEINSVILTGDKSADDLSLAMQEDLTSIKATGTTNATGSTITSGTFFYLNGTLCKAKSDIASGATFTLNTNYEVVTAGGLNSLNSALEYHKGDDIIVNPLSAFGLSISNSRVEVFLPLNKPISADVTSASLVSADTQLYIWTGTAALNMGSSVQSISISADRQSLDFVFNQSSYTPTETGKYFAVTGKIKVSLS